MKNKKLKSINDIPILIDVAVQNGYEWVYDKEQKELLFFKLEDFHLKKSV